MKVDVKQTNFLSVWKIKASSDASGGVFLPLETCLRKVSMELMALQTDTYCMYKFKIIVTLLYVGP